jgi:hypothetical protein
MEPIISWTLEHSYLEPYSLLALGIVSAPIPENPYSYLLGQWQCGKVACGVHFGRCVRRKRHWNRAQLLNRSLREPMADGRPAWLARNVVWRLQTRKCAVSPRTA